MLTLTPLAFPTCEGQNFGHVLETCAAWSEWQSLEQMLRGKSGRMSHDSYTTFVCMEVSYEVCQAKCKHFVLHSYLATGHATCSCWRKAITVAFAERVRLEHLHSGCLTCQSVCSCSNLGNLLSLFSNSTLSD